MSSYSLTAHFFLVLNNIALSGYTTVYLAISPLEEVVLPPTFSNYE